MLALPISAATFCAASIPERQCSVTAKPSLARRKAIARPMPRLDADARGHAVRLGVPARGARRRTDRGARRVPGDDALDEQHAVAVRQDLLDGRWRLHHPENIRLALLPPKANELLMTMRRWFRASRRSPLPATRKAGSAGSASPSQTCGGSMPSVSASQQNAASIAPAAPSACPVRGLVPLTGVPSGKTRAMTRLSISSFLRVAVACRLT